jgi:PAS domain S-box-containing protein
MTMHLSWRTGMVSKVWRYGLAAISCAIALAVALATDAASSCFTIAVVVSSLYGGRGPGILSVGLSALSFDYFFLPPQHHFALTLASYPRFAAFLGAVVLVAILIEAKRRAEKSRRQINAQYRVIAETSRDAILSIDDAGRIFFMNPAAITTFGWAEPDLIGQPLSTVIPDSRLAEHATRAEWTGRRKDGTEFPVEVLFGEVTTGERHSFTGFIRDISLRKQAEAALQKSESYLAEAQKLSKTGSFGLHASTGEIFWTPETFRIFEVDAGTNPSLEIIFDRIHPEDRAEVRDILDRAYQSGADLDFEHRLLMPDGSLKHLHVLARAAGESGALEYIGAAMDITSRKQAEEAVRASELNLRLLVDSIPAWVSTMKPDGEAETVNRQATDYTGKTSEEMKNWLPTLHPDDRANTADCWRRSLETGEPYDVEERIQRADGVYRWFHARGLPLRGGNGNIVRWYIVLTDIEDRKQAQQALRTSERELSLIIETIPALVWSAAPGGELIYVNRRVQQYTGTTLDALARDEWTNLLHPEDSEATVRAWMHAVATGQQHEVQYRLRRWDGAYRWFRVLGQPLRDGEGRVTRWYGLLIDIDDRKRMEDDLRDTQSRLSRASQTATVGELAASIAHEINQPLAAVVTNGHACLRWLTAEPPSLTKVREAAERIVRDGKEAGEVVRRIRALFRRAALEKVTLDMNDVIGEVLHLLGGETTKRRVTVETDLETALPPVVVDRVQMQQLVLNLLINGLDSMDGISDRARKLSIRSRQHGEDTVLVEIRDSGVGLKNPDKIFDAFFTTKENGMGMGLTICRSIVEAHDGRLWASSAEGPGTIFSFTVPLKSSATRLSTTRLNTTQLNATT